MFGSSMQKSELSSFIHAEVASAIKKQRESLEVIIPQDGSPYYTIEKLKILFDKTSATIHNWVKEGRIKKYKVGRNTFFKKSEIDKLIDL